MSSRSSGLRIKVVALLLSLVALWAFAATVTLREGLNLLTVSTLAENLGDPTESLLAELQQERRLSLVYLGAKSDQRTSLNAQRERTDAARIRFRELAEGEDVQDAASELLKRRIDGAVGSLEGLGRSRAAIDSRSVDRGQAGQFYTDVINAGFRIYGSMATLDDPDIAKESRTLVALTRAREVLSQEDALIAGVLAAGKFTNAEHQKFVQLAGAQRFLYAEAEAELPQVERDKYQELLQGSTFARFRALEDRMIDKARAGAPLPIGGQTWKAAVDPLFAELRDLELSAADGTIERAAPAAIGVIIRLGLAGGLGLLAVIASIVMSITTARSLVRQLEKLRTAARELATERLPRVVERLRRGEKVDVAAEAPPLAFGSDEIGQVGRAFNLVQETAVQVAVEQAELRKGVRDVFLSLARRSQALVHRQLSLLDAMERRQAEPEELEDLFRVDHLATRMRRNAENLIVLSGAAPGRGWRNPVPLVDVVRGAVAEVEDYARVTVSPIGASALAGRAVGDVIHLLAELIENAVSFSPPHTVVQVGGQHVANGFVVEIEDRGLGMSAEDLVEANEQLESPPEFHLSSTARLGLYVVGRLSERHQIQVRLRNSPYGGITAVVLIPSALVVDEPDGDARLGALRDRFAAGRAAVPANTGAGERADGDIVRNEGIGAGSPTHAGPRRDRVNQRQRPRETAEPRVLEPLSGEQLETEKREVGRMIDEASATAERTVDVARPVEAERRSEAVTFTPSGLPRRVRQASLAAPLRNGGASTDESDEPAARPPEDIRKMMASYQKGTSRGRTAADQAVPPGPGGAEPLAESAGPAESARPRKGAGTRGKGTADAAAGRKGAAAEPTLGATPAAPTEPTPAAAEPTSAAGAPTPAAAAEPTTAAGRGPGEAADRSAASGLDVTQEVRVLGEVDSGGTGTGGGAATADRAAGRGAVAADPLAGGTPRGDDDIAPAADDQSLVDTGAPHGMGTGQSSADR